MRKPAPLHPIYSNQHTHTHTLGKRHAACRFKLASISCLYLFVPCLFMLLLFHTDEDRNITKKSGSSFSRKYVPYFLNEWLFYESPQNTVLINFSNPHKDSGGLTTCRSCLNLSCMAAPPLPCTSGGFPLGSSRV